MSTLALTRVTPGGTASSTTENNNQAALEALLNGGIQADNMEADAVSAAKLNSDVVRADYGLKQHTDGSLQVDPSDTTPCVEVTDGGLRVKVDDSSIERAAGGIQVKAGGITAAMLAASALAATYPIGSVYINASVSTNQATLLGFVTWAAVGTGRVLVGIDAGQTEFDTLAETGGEKTHILTTSEMPAHTHPINGGGGSGTHTYIQSAVYPTLEGTSNTNSTGGDGAHNNLQPYLVVCMWVRTA
jgi:hypothetical protein